MPAGSPRSLRHRNGVQSTAGQLKKKKLTQDYQHRIITWDELEDWQKDNEYIPGGYRRVQNRWKGCLESVYAFNLAPLTTTDLHNETSTEFHT
ncbi:hypothetical protein D9756_006528 [Leucocoprinus leucothites]|uniref:Uncharacterized protein n=1 Tax=Leucocoprinus leucothites TaxID=201217 RepID=A0A8H5G2I0_9AGAR|nr:hypothetical protein D9756_006528 [Leucoagaricus leucothites]